MIKVKKENGLSNCKSHSFFSFTNFWKLNLFKKEKNNVMIKVLDVIYR